METRDKDHREIVAVGCELAFKKRVEDEINDSGIQKIFVLSEPDMNMKFREFLSYIPLDYLTMGNEIINYIQEKLSTAIYGITLPKKKPFIISCIVAGIVGAFYGIIDLKEYIFGGLGIFEFPAMIDPLYVRQCRPGFKCQN